MKSPILIVDDDSDDLMIMQSVVEQLGIDRPVEYFRTGNELHNYLKTSPAAPLVILCDANLPGETGFDIKKRIGDDKDLQYKSVPFVFWTTAASDKQIQQAYDLPAQGFFFKPDRIEALCDAFQTIVSYWQQSRHPKPIE